MSCERYKDLMVPNMDNIKDIDGAITYNLEDVGGHDYVCILSGSKTGFQYLSYCRGVSCEYCVFYEYNLGSSIDYLLQKGYIDKALALKYSLDNLSKKE